MIVVHKGFDGLDVSFQAQIDQDFADRLEAAQTVAQAERGTAQPLAINGSRMLVEESGAQGGYQYRVDTGDFGATWMFKKPNPNDPWGIRVSMKSLPLAIYGLAGARDQIDLFLDRLGIAVPPNGVSIGRVDFAVDILDPEFELVPDNFIKPRRANFSTYQEAAESRHGSGNRNTGITFGKMPGRQIIFYSKRTDVMKKRKVEWWPIWNCSLADVGLAPLDPKDPTGSNVWRAEFRAGKKELKDRWKIRTWNDLYDRIGDVMRTLSDWATYRSPVRTDSNASRWPLDPIWKLAQDTVRDDLIDLTSGVDPEEIKRVIDAEYQRMLEGQIDGLVVAWAAAKGYDSDGYGDAWAELRGGAGDRAREHRRPIEDRFAKTKSRFLDIADKVN